MSDISNYPELLADMATHAKTLFVQKGIADETAHQVAWDLAEFLRTHWSKQTIYFPEAVSLEARRRAAGMFAEFNGRNIAELAKKYDVSVQHAYRMIRYMRAESVLANQGRLFDDDDDVPKPNLR